MPTAKNGTKIADDVVTSDCPPDGNWAAFIKSNRKLYRISPFDDLGRAVALQWSPDDNGVQYLSTSGGATNVLEFFFHRWCRASSDQFHFRNDF